jgi:plastocyanin
MVVTRFFSMLSVAGLLVFVGAFSAPLVSQAAPVADEMTVGMTDAVVFAPAEVVVPAGSTVTWVNEGVVPHTVTADDGTFDSGQDSTQWMPSGATFAAIFDAPGTYTYHCAVPGHAEMGMVGTIVVQ